MELQNKKVTLVGLGRSSVAAAQLLRQHGARPFISEVGNSRTLERWLGQCEEACIPCETGGHSEDACDRAELIVLSPGVPLTAPLVERARSRGIPILGELELAWHFCTARAIAVTGTNGKTTVTTLLHEMMTAAGCDVALAGNNDTPLSQVVMADKQPEWVVVEVSSYQLETVATFHPAIAVVLNVTPDHLNRHGTLENYAAVKGHLFAQQQPGDTAIRNADDPLVTPLPVPEGVRRISFSLESPGENTFYADDEHIFFGDTPVAACSDSPLPGRHNRANVLAALAAIHAGGFDWEESLAGLRRFKGVEHRIEHVMRLEEVDYYNDSKSTNIESLRVALESFERPVVLIAGGRGKGSNYSVLADLVRARVKHLIAFGEDAPLIVAQLQDSATTEHAASMMDAVRRACAAAAPGDVVLLSPACASFDMYANFEARGRDYKDCLERLLHDVPLEEESCS